MSHPPRTCGFFKNYYYRGASDSTTADATGLTPLTRTRFPRQLSMADVTPHEARKTVFVVGLGMVGIGEPCFLRVYSVANQPWHVAFIEKLLNLDTSMKYRIVTCGEEMHRTPILYSIRLK